MTSLFLRSSEVTSQKQSLWQDTPVQYSTIPSFTIYYLELQACCCYVRPHVCLFVGCLTSQQHVSVSRGRICKDNFSCCHTEIEVANQTFLLTKPQYTDTGPTSPSTDPITPGARQGSHWSANFYVTTTTTLPRKKSLRKRDSNPGSSALEADALTTRPTRGSSK